MAVDLETGKPVQRSGVAGKCKKRGRNSKKCSKYRLENRKWINAFIKFMRHFTSNIIHGVRSHTKLIAISEMNSWGYKQEATHLTKLMKNTTAIEQGRIFVQVGYRVTA
mgnify:CR=1 FL=1